MGPTVAPEMSGNLPEVQTETTVKEINQVPENHQQSMEEKDD
jgi:hypothetical protein